MTEQEFTRAHARFQAFLQSEPVVPILSRNLSFLLDENKTVSAIETGDDLKCYTANGKIHVGGAACLMRDEFDRRHWIAGMRILLAHEVQHANSSDRAILEELRGWSGRYLNKTHGLAESVGEALGQKLLNVLEDGRVNQIVCQRFPGYIPMMRFVNYARRECLGGSACALSGFLDDIESYAITGLPSPNFDGQRRAALAKAAPYIDAAVLAETAAECACRCKKLLVSCADDLAVLCAETDALAAFLASLTLETYPYSEADRAEQRGDGTDSGIRRRTPVRDNERTGEPDDGTDADGDKGDSGSPGSGDNSTRQGDESGSLTGSDVKPKNSAGISGREDRGESASVGRSSNHGQSSSLGIQNGAQPASETARQEGPNSIREVLGTQFSRRASPALTPDELDNILRVLAADLDREAEQVNCGRIAAARSSPLSPQDRNALREQYSGVTYEETFIVPGGNRLPPEYMDRARALHRRLDRILREQRVRTANQRKGALSQKDLWKVEVNARDIFRRKSPPTQRETAFYLLIDRSGSMGTGCGGGVSKLCSALTTAAVIEEALKGLAYTKIVAFDGGLDIVEHCIIKDFHQKEIGSRCIDALTQISAGNGNKDGCSIRVAAMDLEKRTEKRKVLVILSDGLPSAYSKESEAIGDVRAAVQDARRKGIIVIPIIYGTDSAASFEAYQQMYEKGIVSATEGNILQAFEKLLLRLIR